MNRRMIIAAAILACTTAWLTACTPSQQAASPAATVTVTATVTATPASTDHVTGFPQVLQGKWCTEPGMPEQVCFDLAAIASEYPDVFLAGVTPNYEDGTTGFLICLEEDLEDLGATAECSVAASIYLTYFPPGASWQCDAPEGYGTCNPDYSDAHDPSVARLVREHNHQHGDDYADSPPMYRG